MTKRVKCLARLLPLLLLTFGSGCATKALWTNGNLEDCREPASPVNLHLFDAKQKNDLLVVYDEYSERSNKIHTRAYWLDENQSRVDQQRAPHFVNTGLTGHLPSVPVFYGSTSNGTDLTPTFYAVVATNNESFTLYSGDREIGSHDLPVYNDGKGRVEKVALTPVAVTADLSIVGGYLGYYFLCGLVQSGSSYSITVH
jgi:hypothetical protein